MPENDIPCVGICLIDPDSGYCLGCGRPPLPLPDGVQRIVAEAAPRCREARQTADADSPDGGETKEMR